MKVRNHYQTVTPNADLVDIDSTIEDVIEKVSENPASRSVYVVDDKQILVGIISVKEILNIMGAKYIRRRSPAVAHGILAKTAADIMRDPEFVIPDDDLEEALRLSVMHGIEDLPVVDEGKVIGNLDCFELIKGIKDRHK
jgi:CBS domain-containing protein